jgi:hypothetical protein
VYVLNVGDEQGEQRLLIVEATAASFEENCPNLLQSRKLSVGASVKVSGFKYGCSYQVREWL